MIRLANSTSGGTEDYWVSPTFTWSNGLGPATFTHNKGKLVKTARIFFPRLGTGGNDSMVHDGVARDASGSGNDYGCQLSSQTLNAATFYLFNSYPDGGQANCVMYLEFIEPAVLPNQ